MTELRNTWGVLVVGIDEWQELELSPPRSAQYAASVIARDYAKGYLEGWNDSLDVQIDVRHPETGETFRFDMEVGINISVDINRERLISESAYASALPFG